MTRPPADHPVWAPVDTVLDMFRAALDAGDEERAGRLLDAAEVLESHICADWIGAQQEEEIA